MSKPTKKEVDEFLQESNYIENEYSDRAFIDALNAWRRILKVDTLTMYDILKCHEVLMIHLNPSIAGDFRFLNVRVGSFYAPDYREVRKLMTKWLIEHGDANTQEGIKQAHIAFEKIHPFEDGNGRTGRIIMNWQRTKNGLPLEIIHVGDEQYAYYKWFND